MLPLLLGVEWPGSRRRCRRSRAWERYRRRSTCASRWRCARSPRGRAVDVGEPRVVGSDPQGRRCHGGGVGDVERLAQVDRADGALLEAVGVFQIQYESAIDGIGRPEVVLATETVVLTPAVPTDVIVTWSWLTPGSMSISLPTARPLTLVTLTLVSPAQRRQTASWSWPAYRRWPPCSTSAPAPVSSEHLLAGGEAGHAGDLDVRVAGAHRVDDRGRGARGGSDGRDRRRLLRRRRCRS